MAKWKVYICAVESHLEEIEGEGDQGESSIAGSGNSCAQLFRVVECSTPIECQPTTMSHVFARKADALMLVREINSERNGLIYHLKAGERRGGLWSGSDRGYRAEPRRI